MTEERNTIPGLFQEHTPDAAPEQTMDQPAAATEAGIAADEYEIELPEADADQKAPKKDGWRNFKHFIKDVLSVVISAVVIAAALKTFVIDSRIVPTGSMIPTIDIGDRVLILKLPYYFGATPDRLDVVVFAPPEEFQSTDDLLKRVIGLPGDTVEVISGLVYVNGAALEEPYINEPPVKDYGPVIVPEGCYFMMGDNRNNSRDSRGWDDPYVPLSDIKGKVLLCYWPVSDWRIVN